MSGHDQHQRPLSSFVRRGGAAAAGRAWRQVGRRPRVTYQITDADGDVATASLTITIQGQQDAPTTSVTALPGQTTTGDPLPPTDSQGNTLTVTEVVVDADGDGVPDTFPVPPGGTVTVPITDANGNPIGSFTMGSDGSFVFTPAPDFEGNVPPIDYTVSDGIGGESNGELNIYVPGPVLEVIVLPGETGGGDVASGTDANGDPLTVTEVTVDADGDGVPDSFPVPPGGTVTVPMTDGDGNAIGDLTMGSDGSWTFTPAPGFTGEVPPVLVDLSDGSDAVLTINVPDSVTNVNVPSGGVGGGDVVDGTDANGNPLTVTEVVVDTDGDGIAETFPVPPGGSVTVPITDGSGNPIGNLTMGSDGTWIFVPAPGFTGDLPPVLYNVSDGTSGALSISVVTPAIAPPARDNLTQPPSQEASVPVGDTASLWDDGTGAEDALTTITLTTLSSLSDLGSSSLDGDVGVVLQAVNNAASLHSIDRRESEIFNIDQSRQDRFNRTALEPDAFANYRFSGVELMRIGRGAWLELQANGSLVSIDVLDDGSASRVVDVRFTLADGRPLPPWVQIESATRIVADPPPGVQRLLLRMEVRRADGSRGSYAVDVDLKKPQIQWREEGVAPAPAPERSGQTGKAPTDESTPPFAAQLARASRGSQDFDAELMNALADVVMTE